jgi:hypothetical protein
MTALILVELNELNFDYVERYAARGLLPAFARLFEQYGYRKTSSEQRFESIEPWIQWVTAHTGKSFDEHGVFRLGDGATLAGEQIWEHLEKRGLKIGAFCPMNAANRLSNAAFFLPDPWTSTRVSGSPLLKALYSAVAQAVNDNAQKRITAASAAKLLLGLVAYSGKRHILHYGRLLSKSPRSHWARAALLDQLLGDCFLKLWRKTRPDFASVFLNGAAHIQHHYLFNSQAYAGRHRNPDWYVRNHEDPVLEIYRCYDRFLADLLALSPRPRLILATGLHQDPVERPVYYYRLRDHAAFLRKIGIVDARVQPRMSRDFLAEFPDARAAAEAARVLALGRGPSGAALFEIDNRGASLFVTLSYPDRIDPGTRAAFGSAEIADLEREVVFVALKNAQHNGIGYLLDTGAGKASPSDEPAALAGIWDRVVAAF